MERSLQRDLQLDEEDVCRADLRREPVDVGGRERRQGAGNDHDPVVAAVLDQDGGGHRRLRCAQDGCRVDPFLGPEGERVVTEGVCPDSGQDADVGSQPRRADRLVRAFPAVVGSEQVADHGLAAVGHALGPEREPNSVAADDRDPRHARILGRARSSHVGGTVPRTRPIGATTPHAFAVLGQATGLEQAVRGLSLGRG